MKKRGFSALLFAALTAILLLSSLPALAETTTYTFSDIRAQLELDTSDFDMILTPDNLTENYSWLTENGYEPDNVEADFKDTGILLEAFDSANGRTLVITAKADVDAEAYFDINTVEDEVRKNFRQSHTNGSTYSLLGYDYSSATWKNYGKNLQRFLRLKYVLKYGGVEQHKGYQRRTIRNGYTITLDLQVKGRKLKTADEKLLDSILNDMTFTEVLTAPPGACKLIVTEPPTEVNDDTLTVSGTTDAKANVTLALISMTGSTGGTFTDTASSKGKFSIKVKFPESGTYSMVLTASTDDGRTTQRTYSILYEKNYIPLNFTSAVPTQISSDTLTISGTTIKGVKTQISVTGPVTYQKSKTGKSFSFTFDTDKEGTYQILITASKKGMETRTVSYTAVRTLTDAERLQKTKDSAQNTAYKTLKSNLSKYAGKTFTYTGYVLEITPSGSEWTVKFALSKSGTTYKDIVYLICKEEPQYALFDKVRMYGTLSENTYIEIVEGSGTSEYPRFELLFFEDVSE